MFELIPLILGIIIPIIIFSYARIKRVKVSKSFYHLIIVSSLWSFFYFLEIISMTESGTVFWRGFRYACVALMPATVVSFTFSYLGKILSKKVVVLLLIIPLITIFTLLTNSFHNLFFTDEVFVIFNEYSSLIDASNGVFFWIHAIYSYILLSVSLFVLVAKYFEVSKLYKSSVFIIILGLLIPFVGNIVYVVSPLSSVFRYDLTTTMFVFTELLFLFGFINYRFLDLLPVARDYVFNKVINPFFILDENDRIVDFNEPARELINKGVVSFAGNVLGASAINVFKNSNIKLIGTNNFIFNGVNYLSNIFPIIVNGVNSGKVITISDVTVVKKIESLKADIKKESDLRVLSRGFLSRMSHELRQPLIPIMGYADVLVSEVKDVKHKLLLKKIVRESMILRDLIDKTVIVNSLQLGGGLILENASIIDVVNDAIDNYRINYGFKNIKLVKDFGVDVLLMLDVNKFKSLVTNLLDNAVSNTAKGSVKVIISDSIKSVILKVVDTGKGIPPDKIKEIKSAYYVARYDSSVIHTGFGVGLLLVKLVAEAHNGSFEINSKVGSGTEVIVRLPKK